MRVGDEQVLIFGVLLSVAICIALPPTIRQSFHDEGFLTTPWTMPADYQLMVSGQSQFGDIVGRLSAATLERQFPERHRNLR